MTSRPPVASQAAREPGATTVLPAPPAPTTTTTEAVTSTVVATEPSASNPKTVSF